MPTILDKIVATKREEIVRAKAETPLSALEEQLDGAPAVRDFFAALAEPAEISLIAEVKKASPSRGVMLEDADPVDLANVYENAGARAVSVLTDETFFKGSLEDLTSVHQAVAIPCLRKDFVIDEYQIYEARAARADSVLLIVRILSDEQLADYLELATSMKMIPLVETHNAEEIERALKAGAHIIGINNRDLDTLEVNIKTTIELKRLVPGGNVLVSESGVHTRDHVRLLEDGGVDAILVGEALVTSDNIRAKVQELLGTDEG